MSQLFAGISEEADALKSRHAAVLTRHRKALRLQWLIAAVLVATFVYAAAHMEFSLLRFGNGLGQLAHFISLMVPPMVDSKAQFMLFMKGMAETVAIAFLGTFLAAVIAFPLGFLAAKTVVGNWFLHIISRRFLDTVRGVDVLIWALIWINVVGLGPFAGILALMTIDIGAFGKLYSEVIETADAKDIEGVASVGGGQWSKIRFGILPQVLPVMLGQVLYYFESNTRSATIIGIVGAGGIGLHLSEMVRTLEWDKVSFLVICILIVVAIIDQLSGRLRLALVR